MTNIARFERLLAKEASTVLYHREDGGAFCPCVSEEGFRSPQWHIDNPAEPVCNEVGILAGVVVSEQVKGFVQPIQSTRATRLSTENLIQMFGEIEADDHLGIFPLKWGGTTLNFRNWSEHGEDYVLYDEQRFTVVNANKLPDPRGGGQHHWEVGLRLIKSDRPTD